MLFCVVPVVPDPCNVSELQMKVHKLVMLIFYKICHIYLIFTMVLWIKWNILLPHYEYNYTSEKVALPNSIYIASKCQTCWYLVCSPAGRM